MTMLPKETTDCTASHRQQCSQDGRQRSGNAAYSDADKEGPEEDQVELLNLRRE